MYEHMTYETILQRMLDRVPNKFDKREGSVIYDALAPAALELALAYIELDVYLTETFGDTAAREYLIKRARERGLTPEPATYAKVKGLFTPTELSIPIGARFSYDDVNYAVTEKVSSGVYFLTCEAAGIAGNKSAGMLLPIDYVAGLQTATLMEVTVPGEDEEATEVFRARYLASFNSQAYGGNIADYREKVNKIQGIGGVKVYPVWQGGGTVRIAFMTSEFKPPTPEFVSEVQELIDPIPYQGEGLGIAPIGHIVTVGGVSDSQIAIGLPHLSFASGTYDDYKDDIEATIDTYFAELNKDWQSTQRAEIDSYSNTGLVVRISQIESRLLDIEGIEDIQDTTLNGVGENLTLGVDELAVRGEVTNE
ncbi:baseplate J/gp47 family protein [Sporomusa paucivorans]|uniref:baseplate J/gp47 family protein n=1 Tax=Sporomusa paucivorans TaxID=2376 RepID=UPI0035710FDB